MGEKNSQNNKQKKPIQILRERNGGVSEKLLKKTRRQTSILKNIKQSIETASKTVPEIAQITNIPSYEVLWHLMAMKKYRMVIEGAEQEGYYQYSLKSEEKKK